MAITVLIAPNAQIPNPGAANGTPIVPNAAGWASVPDVVTVRPLLDAGQALLVPQLPTCTTGGRPTANLQPGMAVLDSTLGKPVFRNAANSGWIDSTGAGV